MFGMTVDSANNDGESDEMDADQKSAAGFKGRFKASALVATEALENYTTEAETLSFFNSMPVHKGVWSNPQHHKLAYQTLLPILAAPKPNKRDKNGYFDKKGNIKGAKCYRFGSRDTAEFHQETQDRDYTHRLRNWAQVCDKELVFNGVLGAENCTPREIAAFLLLLEHHLAQHGFKLGMGKAFGMGNVISSITKLWVRNAHDYTWKSWNCRSEEDMTDNLESHVPGVKKAIQELKNKHNQIQKLNKAVTQKLAYPSPSPKYWREAGKI
jgi:hypothetical protein